jgi:hypothetical protein
MGCSPPAPPTACAVRFARGSQLLTRAPVENGSCVVSYLCSMTPAYLLADVCQGLKLTLDGLPRGFLAEPQNRVQSRGPRASVLFTPDATAAHRTSLCLHALSSFQRTGCSITPASHHWPPPRVLDPHRSALTPSSGEPCEITLTFRILSSHCALHRCIATRLTTRAAPVTDKRCWGEV